MEVNVNGDSQNTWNIWSKYVVSEISRLNDEVVNIKGEIESEKRERQIANSEMIKILNEISKTVERITSDIDWLKRFFWIIMTGLTASIIATIFNRLAIHNLK
jgi:peptidoglycan hydrolase CwlO-like protein